MGDADRLALESELAHARATVARLEALLGAAPLAYPTEDLVPLKVAAHEFRRSLDTVRRWATELGLGVKIDGKWHLSRSRVKEYRGSFA